MTELSQIERDQAKSIGIAVYRRADGKYRVSPPTIDSLGLTTIDADKSGLITPSLDEVRECIRCHIARP